jgi:integrase/recombinase XerC
MPNTSPYPIQSFLDYLKFEKRYSQHTISAYESDLVQFFGYLQHQYNGVELRDITASFIRSWLAALMNEEEMKAKSINRKISSLKSYFKFQLRMGTIEKMPTTTLVAPKLGKRLPVFAKQEETDNFFTYFQFPDTWQGHTDQLIMSVFYNTGMRLSELVNLKEKQVDTGNKAIKVLGKGNKERIIPVNASLLGMVNTYISNKRKEIEQPDTEFLLVNAKGKKLYPRYVYQRVNLYLKEMKTLDKRSPHVLRHTFATHMMNHGADLNAVKELLGHASLAATQVYTHNTIEKLKEVFKKAHPKA